MSSIEQKRAKLLEEKLREMGNDGIRERAPENMPFFDQDSRTKEKKPSLPKFVYVFQKKLLQTCRSMRLGGEYLQNANTLNQSVLLFLLMVGKLLASISKTMVPVSSVYRASYCSEAAKSSSILYFSKTELIALFLTKICARR